MAARWIDSSQNRKMGGVGGCDHGFPNGFGVGSFVLFCFCFFFGGIPSLPKVMVEHFSIKIVSDPSGGLISSRGKVTSSIN